MIAIKVKAHKPRDVESYAEVGNFNNGVVFRTECNVDSDSDFADLFAKAIVLSMLNFTSEAGKQGDGGGKIEAKFTVTVTFP